MISNAGQTGHRVRRRLRNLAVLELVNIPLQFVAWFGVIGLPVTAPNLVGFAAFAVLLVEGAAYWWVKVRQTWSRLPGLPGADHFRRLRTLNPVFLAAAVLGTGYAVVADPGRGTIPGLCFALFAVLEHINYFHVQLMHDTAADVRRLVTKGFRRSHLARDLAGG